MNARLCAQHMRAGVTIVDPATTYLEPELAIGRDTVIYQNTSIGRLSEIGEGCTVGQGGWAQARRGPFPGASSRNTSPEIVRFGRLRTVSVRYTSPLFWRTHIVYKASPM